MRVPYVVIHGAPRKRDSHVLQPYRRRSAAARFHVAAKRKAGDSNRLLSARATMRFIAARRRSKAFSRGRAGAPSRCDLKKKRPVATGLLIVRASRCSCVFLASKPRKQAWLSARASSLGHARTGLIPAHSAPPAARDRHRGNPRDPKECRASTPSGQRIARTAPLVHSILLLKRNAPCSPHCPILP